MVKGDAQKNDDIVILFVTAKCYIDFGSLELSVVDTRIYDARLMFVF
jgi:hypothetical protein